MARKDNGDDGRDHERIQREEPQRVLGLPDFQSSPLATNVANVQWKREDAVIRPKNMTLPRKDGSEVTCIRHDDCRPWELQCHGCNDVNWYATDRTRANNFHMSVIAEPKALMAAAATIRDLAHDLVKGHCIMNFQLQDITDGRSSASNKLQAPEINKSGYKKKKNRGLSRRARSDSYKGAAWRSPDIKSPHSDRLSLQHLDSPGRGNDAPDDSRHKDSYRPSRPRSPHRRRARSRSPLPECRSRSRDRRRNSPHKDSNRLSRPRSPHRRRTRSRSPLPEHRSRSRERRRGWHEERSSQQHSRGRD
ncbi:hypothetical protein QBC34DRAFT_431322 [Podospora aff. communis PSN243]|uniref:Uncharacterized protein n=1 Tax=Podospora aff. communis PSN243 TaxID=3040156 RepID=A0AAV9G5X2_9PEZI|nr:hypothetical protein QBC34DRAFT_431322 [Podospora aff. communis PSN243]